uniref:Peroxidase n=1 Tax=Solanum lycopersicum TaxID=4081 RepID=A0A3Q7EX40_SOLLC
TCPQSEDIIKEQVNQQQQNNAFSWLWNVFHDCFVESYNVSLLLELTSGMLSEMETDRSFGMRNFRYIDTIKEAVERESHDFVSCTDVIVLSGRDGIVAVRGPHIPLKTGRRHGRRSRADILEQHLPSHNGSLVLCLRGAHSVFFPQCIKLVQRLYPEVDPQLNPEHVHHILKKCPNSKAVHYVRNDRGTPMKLDNNYYRNILDNKGLMLVDQLAIDKRAKLYVKKMAKSQHYFFKEFSRAITVLSKNNPLTGTKGEIRKQYEAESINFILDYDPSLPFPQSLDYGLECYYK